MVAQYKNLTTSKKEVIAPGSNADLVVVDLDRKVTVTSDMVHISRLDSLGGKGNEGLARDDYAAGYGHCGVGEWRETARDRL